MSRVHGPQYAPHAGGLFLKVHFTGTTRTKCDLANLPGKERFLVDLRFWQNMRMNARCSLKHSEKFVAGNNYLKKTIIETKDEWLLLKFHGSLVKKLFHIKIRREQRVWKNFFTPCLEEICMPKTYRHEAGSWEMPQRSGDFFSFDLRLLCLNETRFLRKCAIEGCYFSTAKYYITIGDMHRKVFLLYPRDSTWHLHRYAKCAVGLHVDGTLRILYGSGLWYVCEPTSHPHICISYV